MYIDNEFIYGAGIILEFAILGFLMQKDMHGYELKKCISMLTGHYKPLSDGALYPAIKRLVNRGMIEERMEKGKAGAPRKILELTENGHERFLERLRHPGETDISDRNRLFTFMAFFSYLSTLEQISILERRVSFIDGGKSFFTDESGNPVKIREEEDIFRRGMLKIARETNIAEKKWLLDTISELKNLT